MSPMSSSLRAITVEPGRAASARLGQRAEPVGNGALLARTWAVGICGTDREILAGDYGRAPPDQPRMVIGHESVAQVLEAPPGCGFEVGDLVAGIVRRPDPEPCASCARGDWDMCRNGRYTERGIRELDGFAAEQIRLEPEFAVRLDPALGLLGVLLEPASVVAKAWEQVYRIGARSPSWMPTSVLITGAGPIGLLAAMMGRQRGLQVQVFDRVEHGAKPQLVRDLGAAYFTDSAGIAAMCPDIVIECTGAAPVVLDALEHTAASGIVCLAGVSSGGHSLDLDLGVLNRRMVLENDVVFGSVNANRRHYELAAGALGRADPAWLSRLITRRVPLARWTEAFDPQPDDVKVVLDFRA